MNGLIIQSNKSLEDKLNDIILPEEQESKIAQKELSKGIFAGILESIGLSSVVKISEIAEKIQNKISEAKKAILLSTYFSTVDDINEETAKLKEFVLDPVGNTLFNKIIRIVNINPPNQAYVELLAKVLRKVTHSDFSKLFSKHDYALNQIEKLTPQALLILNDCKRWPEYKIGNYASQGGVITTQWTEAFSTYYTEHIKITDEEIRRRIAHAIKELLRNDLIMNYVQGERDSKDLSSIKESTSNKTVCDLTELGREIIEYIE